MTPLPKMKMFYSDEQVPQAEKFCTDVLSLPIHPFMKDYEVAQVCDCIGEFYGLR